MGYLFVLASLVALVQGVAWLGPRRGAPRVLRGIALSTVGVLGLGHIGGRVARTFAGLPPFGRAPLAYFLAIALTNMILGDQPIAAVEAALWRGDAVRLVVFNSDSEVCFEEILAPPR